MIDLVKKCWRVSLLTYLWTIDIDKQNQIRQKQSSELENWVEEHSQTKIEREEYRKKWKGHGWTRILHSKASADAVANFVINTLFP